tara:strand:- start:16719 stop:17798 length:1080 start_codon:yes stop_codon:yes gene_type:complete
MTKARDLANIISGGLTADDIPALPASKITSGSLSADRIPDLPTSKITSGTLADARIPDLATSKITSGTFADARLASSNVTQHVDLTSLSASNLTSGTVPSARLSLSASDVPNLDTAKVTTGTFSDARLSSSSVTQHVDLTALSASNLTSGTVPSARLSLSASDVPALATSKITSGTFDDARFAASNITQHVDLSNLSASNLTSGTMPDARFPATLPAVSGANLTNTSVASTVGNWTPSFGVGNTHSVTAKYVKVGKICHCRCSFYTSGTESSRSDTQLLLSGLPFTAASSDTYAGGGRAAGFSQANGDVFVLSGTNTLVIIGSVKPPSGVLYTGARTRRHSFRDDNELYFRFHFTYATA